MEYDIVILGSGPAGLTAALYAARAGKSTMVLGGNELGGQTATIAKLENYPGFMGSGLELAEKMRDQAKMFGATIKMTSAQSVKTHGESFSVITTGGDEYIARAVIIATGASPRKMQITGVREFFGRGVSYCATCDGFFYTDKDVLVIGGGNSALNDALYLANIARSVKIIYRRDTFSRAEKILSDRVNDTKNISVLWNTELTEVGGDASGVTFAKTSNMEQIECDGVFIAIGHEANTDFLGEEYKRDNMGRIIAGDLPRGIFVAGDVRAGIKMQVATAVGTGCDTAMDAIAYLNSVK
ncbi:MAG: FAD-dependent oxidoreductase [Rickettsiales bacterium]|jgi:thioredoxin reductase (NADPH)|nr:FAD-dependent oxidoreductase [Rickettsiales bacterium]